MTGVGAVSFEPFRPPMIGAATWQTVLSGAGWRCECTGRCGKPHRKTEGRCGTVHGAAHRLAAVPADPTVTLTAAVTTASLVALCAGCEIATRRAAINAQTAIDPDQLDLFGDQAA
jgi:hypothetical protein